jgi:hypothetical protein
MKVLGKEELIRLKVGGRIPDYMPEDIDFIVKTLY